MNILVTGGTGLVGTSIARTAKSFPDYNITTISSKDCNLLDEQETNKFVNSTYDTIVHLAADVGGLFKNMNQKVQMFENNMQMNMNILRAAHKSGIKNFIGTLSTCIFPDKTTYPIDETMLHAGPPHNSNDAYAYAKRMLDIQCQSYNQQFGTNYSCIIPTNIYGDHDNYNLQDAHVIPALIHKCYLAKSANKPFVVAGTGKPLRQFIHSDDLAYIILRLLGKLDRENIIISCDEEVSIGHVSKIISRAFDYEDSLIFDESLSDGQYKKTANPAKLRNKIPGYKFIEIETGINKTVKYFTENYNKIRK